MPRDHYIPQSIIGGFVTQGDGVPWFEKETGQRTVGHAVRDTAMVLDGNSMDDDAFGEPLRTESEWTEEFDRPMGSALDDMSKATLGGDRFTAEARAVVVGAVSMPFRHPSHTFARLESTLAIQSVLARTRGGSAQHIEEVVAGALGTTVKKLKELGLPGHVLAALDLDEHASEIRALEDVLNGPLSRARIARNQWLNSAWPTSVLIQDAPDGHRFQIADCGIVIDEYTSRGWADTVDPTIWTNPLSVNDEVAAKRPRGKGRDLRLTITVSSTRRIVARFRGRQARKSYGWVTYETVSPNVVIGHNRIQWDRAAHWIFGDETP